MFGVLLKLFITTSSPFEYRQMEAEEAAEAIYEQILKRHEQILKIAAHQ